MSNAYLEIREGPDVGTTTEIPPETTELVIGRSPECGMVVAAPSVSRRHARLWRDGEGFRLEDLGSANGTTVNGDAVTAAVALRDGDLVCFGSVQVLFVNPPPPLPVVDDSTIAIPPGEDATILAPPPSAAKRHAAGPSASPVEPPSPRAASSTRPTGEMPPPAPPSPPPASTPAAAETLAQPAISAPEPPAVETLARAAIPSPPHPATTHDRDTTRGPAPLELVAIGAGSFLAVFLLGTLVRFLTG